MANQKRKSAKAKPITSNPLFPAVVALWFGALFGLGSLAVRPSLLEEIVLNSHIDLVIPAAAPPLGLTARILLTLTMAALGGILGIMLTRRLTRPEANMSERKRSTKDMTHSLRTRLRDAHRDAPAHLPLSTHTELGGTEGVEDNRTPAMAPGILANRRRALAIIQQVPQFVPPELAPTTVAPSDAAEAGNAAPGAATAERVPAAVVEQFGAAALAPAAFLEDDDPPVDDDSLTADSADNPYASLLGLAPPRQAFVQMHEPEAAAHEAPEPVVIFPGQAPPVAPVVATAPATGEVNAFRSFDAPATAGQGEPVAVNSAAATVDPAEAEQALRTALSNLQRISGAA